MDCGVAKIILLFISLIFWVSRCVILSFVHLQRFYFLLTTLCDAEREKINMWGLFYLCFSKKKKICCYLFSLYSSCVNCAVWGVNKSVLWFDKDPSSQPPALLFFYSSTVAALQSTSSFHPTYPLIDF